MSQPLELSRYNNASHERGFTLVEVLIALTLLTTALVPTFLLSSSALQLSNRIKNSLIAANLAQEGVEVVRAIRDANWFSGAAFSAGLGGCESGCVFQHDSVGPVTGVVAGTPLKLDPSTGLYQYSTGADTVFDRTVTITATADEIIISSVVSWQERSIARSTTLEYHLYNWAQ